MLILKKTYLEILFIYLLTKYIEKLIKNLLFEGRCNISIKYGLLNFAPTCENNKYLVGP